MLLRAYIFTKIFRPPVSGINRPEKHTIFLLSEEKEP